MSQVYFDPSERLDLFFRVNRAGSKTITFTDDGGAAYDITSNTFQVLLKDSFGNTILTLTQDSGITVTPTNQLTISITASQSNIPPAEYYWELVLTNIDKTWLNGKAFFHTGVFDAATDSAGVTITQGEDVTLTVSDSGDTINITVYETGTYEATQSQVNTGTATGVYVSPKTLEEKVVTVTASGTDTYTATIPGTLTSGRRVYVLFTNANTGAATLNGTAIKKSVSTALSSGDIAAGEIKLLAYDGTNFQVVGGGSGSPGILVEGGDERKITSMTAITAASVDPATDLFTIVDTSDTTDAASGTNKKLTVDESKKLFSAYLTSRAYVPTGRWCLPWGNFISNFSNRAIVANTLYAFEFPISDGASFDRIGAMVGALAASSSFRLGVYTKLAGSLYPDALVSGTDIGNLDSGSTGLKTNTIAKTLTAGTYFVALVSDGAPSIRGGQQNDTPTLFGAEDFTSLNNTNYGIGLSVAYTFGALPANFPGGASIIGASTFNTLGIGLRRS